MLSERHKSLELQGGLQQLWATGKVSWIAINTCLCLLASCCQEHYSEVTTNWSPSQKKMKYHARKAPLRGSAGRIHTLMWNTEYVKLGFALWHFFTCSPFSQTEGVRKRISSWLRLSESRCYFSEVTQKIFPSVFIRVSVLDLHSTCCLVSHH